MATIDRGRHVLTLINVFTVEPERQGQLVPLGPFEPILCEAAESVEPPAPSLASAR